MKMKSGIYARIGAETKDLITECTAREFKDWAKSRGFDVDFMSDETLSDQKHRIGFRFPFQYAIRNALIHDFEDQGLVVCRVRDEWDAFAKFWAENSG